MDVACFDVNKGETGGFMTTMLGIIIFCEDHASGHECM
jgi:hypothetical protein